MKHLLLIPVLLFTLCASQVQAAPLQVMASIGPVKYLAQRIGGDLVSVDVLVTPGASPATYEPKPKQMATLAKSALLFAVSVPFEKAWLPRITAANPGLRVVHTDASIEKIAMAAHHHEGEPADHDHGGIQDPHVWTSPRNYLIMADNVLRGLKDADPANAKTYQANHARLAEEIRAMDRQFTELFAPFKGASFMVYHPAWGYFAQAYSLEQIPVELEGKEPGPRELAQFIRLAAQKAVKAIFVQPQFSRKSATAIASAVGATVVPIDPLAEEWLPGLERAAKLLRSGLR